MKKTILILLVAITFVSCKEEQIEKSCANLPEVVVNKVLYEKYGNDYCRLIISTINKDKKSTLQLFSLEELDLDLSSFHGEVLIQVVKKNGQDNIISFLDTINKRDSFKLNFYFENGFRITKIEEFSGKEFSDIFPKLRSFLEDKM